MAAFGIPSLSPELEATIAAGLADTERLLNSRIEGRYLFANETSDRKSTRLNSSHVKRSRMPSSA